MVRDVRDIGKVAVLACVWTAALAALPCAADEPDITGEPRPLLVSVSVRPDSATVGDRLFYTVDVDAAEGASFMFPDVASGVAPFELLDTVLEPEVTRNGRVTERRTFVIAAFETGELHVPPLEFSFVSAEGDSGTVLTDSLPVVIGSVLPEVKESEEVGPKDIKPPFELPRRVWPYVVIALAAAAIGAAVYFLRRWLRSRRTRPVVEVEEAPRVPRRAAHVVANERFDALERDDPIGRGQIAFFYVRVTEIVRLYLRDRFDVDAIDMTTSELAPAMRDARIESGDVNWTTRYLEHADLAKFAKHEPSAERARADFAEAREFVDRTRFHGAEGGDAGDSAGDGAGDAGDGSGDAGNAVGDDAGEGATADIHDGTAEEPGEETP